MLFLETLLEKKIWHFRMVTLILLGLAFFLYLGFGLFHLGKFQTADEDLWVANPHIGRVHKYWDAMEKHLWEKTHINDKPGITTALVSGSLGLLIDTHPNDKMKNISGTKAAHLFNPDLNEKTFFFFRLPILLVNGLLILLIAWLLFQYTRDERFAILAGCLLFLSPILIGISQIINPDATVWSFGLASLFAYFVFLRREKFSYLLLAGVLAGFALLSKYSATYILLFVFFATFVHLLFDFSRFPDRDAFSRYVLKVFLGYIAFLTVVVSVFSLLMPAVFWHPEYIYQGTVGFKLAANVKPLLALFAFLYAVVLFEAVFWKSRSLFYLLEKLQKMRYPLILLFTVPFGLVLLFSFGNWMFYNPFQLPDLSFDIGRFKSLYDLELWQKILIETKVLPFTITPLVLGFSLCALILFSWRRKLEEGVLLLLLATFMIFFYAAVTLQDVMISVRYGIFLYPAMAILAAFGISEAFRWLEERFSHPLSRKNLLFPGIVLLAISISAANVFLARPFYFNYMNIFLPKYTLVAGAWGYGGYEAAQYLNAFPNAKELVVWTDYDGFCPFFVGECLRGTTINWYEKGRGNIDYFIMSRRGASLNKNIWKKLRREELFEDEHAIWSLSIDGREKNYIRIYGNTGKARVIDTDE